MVNKVNIKIKNVLLKLEEKGFKAYVVGGFVRDYILGNASYDVDIATSAQPKDIKEIFDLNSSTDDNYGSVYFKDSLYNYDITTFRSEKKYEDRKPVEFDYIDSIEEDVKRRDFTINALYMDSEGNIIDLVEGQKDIENKTIRVIGDIEAKMIEDPLRMLRAIRFSSLLEFEMDANLYNYIRRNKQLIRTLSFTRKKEELDAIFNDQNKLRGISLIKDLGIEDELEIKIPKDIKIVARELGIWAQITYSTNYQFKNNDLSKIEDIKRVVSYGIIDNIVLYECGLYVCMIAGEILDIPMSYISDIYKNLPIYSVKDITINGNDIMEILHLEPSEKIKDIIFDLEINILNNNLKNEPEELKAYLIKNWR